MAIMGVEVSTHSQQDFLHLFSGIGLRDEQPATGTTRTFDRVPWLNRFKKLEGSGLAHVSVSHRQDASERSSSYESAPL
jgi:hypothetical protein